MVTFEKEDKKLVVPKSLGNFNTEGGSGGGVGPEEAAEIASAVTEAAIDEYDAEIQVDLEELRDAISASTGTLLDLSEIAAMSIADRVALFDEIFEKVSNGEKAYIKGLVQEETIRTAILPLVSYRPESNPVLHQGGYLYFASKGDTDNVYFHVALSSEGSIDPTSGSIIKRNIYNLPTASAEVKGGVRIGSGLAMTQDTLSVDTTGLVTDGDLAPFIVQQSANTENIATLSAATEAISESLGNYATTATTDELATAISGVSDSLSNYATTATTDALSAVTSALTENLEALSGGTPTIYSAGTDYGWCVVYSYRAIESLPNGKRKDVFTEIKNYSSHSGGGKLLFVLEVPTGAGNTDYIYTLSSFGALEATFVCFTGEEYKYYTLKNTGIRSFGTKPLTYSAGSGVSISNRVVSLNIGEGLAFSGSTLVASGGSSNTKVVMLNKLSQQERLDLYNELSSLYDYDASGWSSAYTEDMYAFYLDLRSYADQNLAQTADRYEGFYPMECCRMHPTDYGGAAFFTGVEQSREGNGQLICIRLVIDYQGNVDGPSTWLNNPPAEQLYIAPVSFGNDGRGGLTYDADNGYFIYDSNNVATGDTQNYCEDLIDYLFLTSLFNRNGKYENYYLINVHSLDVVTGGTTYHYTAPTLGIRDITSYTIGDYTFQKEATFKYADWELKIDVPESNIGANLRISAL